MEKFRRYSRKTSKDTFRGFIQALFTGGVNLFWI